MGFPSISFPGRTSFAEYLPEALQVHRRDRTTYTKLIGNGMHIACLFGWIGYVFTHCVRRHDLERLALPLPAPEDENDLDDVI